MIRRLLLLHSPRRQRSIEAIARHVTEQSIDAVVEIVADRIPGMSLCEARGYIRARATAELRRQTRQALRQIPEADERWETAVMTLSGDRIGPAALRRCMSQRDANIANRVSRAA